MRIIYFRSQLNQVKSIPLIQVHQKGINLTRSSEIWIGPYNEISHKKLTSPNCVPLLARYLPKPIDCGLNNTFCTVKEHKKVVACYWNTWSMYRPTNGEFSPENVNPSLCTHLVYNFAGMDTKNDSLISLDLTADFHLSGYKNATNLKITYPHLKVMNKGTIF